MLLGCTILIFRKYSRDRLVDFCSLSLHNNCAAMITFFIFTHRPAPGSVCNDTILLRYCGIFWNFVFISWWWLAWTWLNSKYIFASFFKATGAPGVIWQCSATVTNIQQSSKVKKTILLSFSLLIYHLSMWLDVSQSFCQRVPCAEDEMRFDMPNLWDVTPPPPSLY